jgi:hypothetical protein
VIFRLLDEPVPTLADPFPGDDPLPGACELHLAADNVTIWYTVTVHEGRDVISIQHVSLDTEVVAICWKPSGFRARNGHARLRSAEIVFRNHS